MKNLIQTDILKSTSSQEDTLANLSPLQVANKVKKIRDTSGQSILDLSKNSDQLGLLEKTLVDMLNSVSTPYSRTWRVKVTPQGRLVFQLRASVPTIKGRESGLWRTPDAHGGRGPSSKERMKMKLKKKMPISLNDQVAHPNLMWPTPTAISRLNEGNVRMLRKKVMSGELSREEAEQMIGKDVFEQQGKVQKIIWSTPTARDWRSGKASEKTLAKNTRPLSEQTGGQLNPMWVEWLMGYPKGWTDLNR